MKRYLWAVLAALFFLRSAGAEPAEPFAFADFSWLNGNSRQKYSLIDTKYFTGQFQVDANYIYSFNHPADHTIDGSSETGRHNEIQVQQLGIGGDFHFANVRGRLMTQFGLYSQMTPRSDGSVVRGQWNLAGAHQYVSEAYGGYHFEVWNGLNIDAGIFMSYVGLFSYYNFENWAYQPSFVSANTPWFFNGIRVQAFPTDHFKAELWLVNGWQSYGMYNEFPGIGFELLYRPNGNLSLVSNGYVGFDTLNNSARLRVHSDSSVQVKYHDEPKQFLDKAAFSVTFDAGCESGGGVSCAGGSSPAQSVIGFMLYHRVWLHQDLFAFTVGGGAINNPGRYLILVPPINGATAATGAAPYFSTGAGESFFAWDSTLTFDIMPNQFITFRFEFNHRQADVPYFVGPGGISGPGAPDLVKTEDRLNFAMMVRL